MTDQILTEQKEQAQRIETILSGLMNPTQYHSIYVYSDEGISFRIDDANGQIMCESNSPTSAREIQQLTHQEIENRLKMSFAKTLQLLYLTSH